MANNYMWKDKYYNSGGANIVEYSPNQLIYVSLLGNNSDINTATKENPLKPNLVFNKDTYMYILSSGAYNIQTALSGSRGLSIFGSGNTTINNIISAGGYIQLLDCTINNHSGNTYLGNTYLYYRCIINHDKAHGSGEIRNNIITKDQIAKATYASNNSYIGLLNISLSYYNNNNLLFCNSNINISQTDLNNNRNSYYGFDNCKFKIGDETDYTPLIGDTEVSLRQNFVERCIAQGMVVPNINEFGENLLAGRWIFARNSTNGGSVITDSIIDKFQKRKFVYLGWSQNTVDPISITNEPNVVQSFSSKFPNKGNLNITEGSASIPDTIDITDKYDTYITSNPFWLGGKYKLNNINILNNLPAQYGVLIDKNLSLDFNNPIKSGESKIMKDEYYIVRSSNKQPASITYNGNTYTTSLNTRDNIFIGVSGATSFTTSTGSPVTYKVLDLAVQSTIEMRIVNELPTGNITNGNLQAGYWYFVEPNNTNDQSGTVTYKGVQYPCMSSFLVDSSTLSFTINGTCHLRRCWREEYSDNNTETTDKAFWASKQKPYWCDIVPDDFRCLKTANSSATNEMMLDKSKIKYFTTGHSEFYKLTNGDAGYVLPIYDITGAYVQFRISFSSLNPM